jgi:L-gulono-1,4-lactone dehydrogenase
MSVTWSNWAGEQICAPQQLQRPPSEQELQETVAQAAAAGLKVRAVGAGHSFTDCACTDGVMIDMSAMDKVVSVDHKTCQVVVEGGARLAALGPQLASQGLALENQGDIDRQSITGAISTATHGTGIKLRNLSAQIRALRIVTATGEVISVSDADQDIETYLAARVSLGALGVISQVTVQCVPLYTLHRSDVPLPLDETLARLDEHVDGNDHFEFFVFPYTDRALTRSTRRSLQRPSGGEPAWKRYVEEELLENKLLGALCRAGRAAPWLTPRINRTISAALSASEVEDRAYKVYATTRNVRFTEMEYALPREHARAAVEQIMAMVPRRELPILFPLEVRFAAGDDAFLSTAHQRDSCYIAVHQYHGMEFETFFRACEQIFDAYDGRPHWGKRHYQTAASLSGRYPQWDRFIAVRDRLDPDRVFTNDYTRRVFGD